MNTFPLTASLRLTTPLPPPILCVLIHIVGIGKGFSLVAQLAKNPPAMQETQVQSLGGDDPLEKENGNPLQYSCLENSMDRVAWQVAVHGITKESTRLSD